MSGETDLVECYFPSSGDIIWDARVIFGLTSGALAAVILFSLIIWTATLGPTHYRRGWDYYTVYSITFVGLVLLLVDNILWILSQQKSIAVCYLPLWMWIFYCIGMPLTIIPVLLINWRIVCLYITTYSISLKRQSPLHLKKREGMWLFRRFLVLLVPFLSVYVIVMLGGDSAGYVACITEIVGGVALALVATRLLTLHEQLRIAQPHLVTHAMLAVAFAYSIALYVLLDQTWMLITLSNHRDPKWLDYIFIVLVDILLFITAAMWIHYALFVSGTVSSSFLTATKNTDGSRSIVVNGSSEGGSHQQGQMLVLMGDGNVYNLENLNAGQIAGRGSERKSLLEMDVGFKSRQL